mmetsp:Transcript_33509/g.94251  ORF Transcript_33509/g.94251 Transcript_33509/m.94251 type:complete len:379 (-) Transcript_33509:894-2030(-)
MNLVSQNGAERKVQHMCTRMVGHERLAPPKVNREFDSVSNANFTLFNMTAVQYIRPKGLDIFNKEVPFPFRQSHRAHIMFLTSSLSVKVGAIQHNSKVRLLVRLRGGLHKGLVGEYGDHFCSDIFQIILEVVVRGRGIDDICKMGNCRGVQLHSIGHALGLLPLVGLLRDFLLLQQEFLNGFFVILEAVLLRLDSRQIYREAKDRIKLGSILWGKLRNTQVVGPLHHGIELSLPITEGLGEQAFLLLEHPSDGDLLLLQTRECTSQGLHHVGNELVEETSRGIKFLVSEPHCAAKNAPHDVRTSGGSRFLAVSDGNGQHTDVVGNDTERHVVLVSIFIPHFPQVRGSFTLLLDTLEDILEQIDIVVGHFPLEDRTQAF